MDYMSYIRAIRSSDLPSNAKITAIMIASHYDFSKGDAAWPSNKTLAKETGLSVRSVIRAKKVLTESHYLVSHRQYNNVCLSYPSVPESQPYGHSGNLNTHINTHRNTQLNTQLNNDNLLYFKSQESTLDINDLVSFKDGSPAAPDLIDWFG